MPEVGADELDGDLMGAAIAHHGSVIVRGFFDDERIERSRHSIVRATDALNGDADAAADGWYEPTLALDQGQWALRKMVGESNGVLGKLQVRPLGPGRYYGKFASEDGMTRFVLNMQQPLVAIGRGDELLPGNLVQFTWQDGRGGRGKGWALINPEDSALAGEIRLGGGAGPWNFVRAEERSP